MHTVELGRSEAEPLEETFPRDRKATGRSRSRTTSYNSAGVDTMTVPTPGTGIRVHRAPTIHPLARDAGCRITNPIPKQAPTLVCSDTPQSSRVGVQGQGEPAQADGKKTKNNRGPDCNNSYDSKSKGSSRGSRSSSTNLRRRNGTNKNSKKESHQLVAQLIPKELQRSATNSTGVKRNAERVSSVS